MIAPTAVPRPMHSVEALRETRDRLLALAAKAQREGSPTWAALARDIAAEVEGQVAASGQEARPKAAA